jgi:hypothetical protein
LDNSFQECFSVIVPHIDTSSDHAAAVVMKPAIEDH